MDRKEEILNLLKIATGPQSASSLAAKFSVSRQVIVGDVALLRASGAAISATPRGYVYEDKDHPFQAFGFLGTIACKHTRDALREELYTIVDFGGTVIDVTIEHVVYGQLSGPLDIGSRHDADIFLEKLEVNQGQPLCNLTGGIHLHKIGCRDEKIFNTIKAELNKKGIAFS